MPDIFLSYAREDLQRARTLADALTNEGWSVFWDRQIPPGRSFEDYIEAQIKASRVVAVLWSPHSVTSHWVRLEAAHARDREPPVLIPILIARAEIPFAFGHLQAADLSTWKLGDRGIEYEGLLSSIEALAPRSGRVAAPLADTDRPPTQAKTSPPAPASSHASPWAIVVAIVAIVLVLLFLRLRTRATQARNFAADRGQAPAQSSPIDPSRQTGRQMNPGGRRGQPGARTDRINREAAPVAGGGALSLPDEFVLSTDPVTHLVKIPAGTFLMGSDRSDQLAERNEFWPNASRGSVHVDDFYIGKTEVTVGQYRQCARAGACRPSNAAALNGDATHPVVNVSWRDALQYCDWLQRTLTSSATAPTDLKSVVDRGWRIGLPSEAEWEKAARGTDGRLYPWGETIRPERANYAAGGQPRRTMPVGSFASGASPYGILDMAGNVWEWTRSLPRPYPYVATDGRENLDVNGLRVLRGGSFASDAARVRAAYRTPVWQQVQTGFRIVLSNF